MSLYAIGDIHGCLDQLQSVIDQIKPGEDDTLVFVGDYIDRGPDSRGVIDYLRALSERCECIFLRGNHEEMMLMAGGSSENARHWIQNGGGATLRSYGISGQVEVARLLDNVPEAHFHFIADTLQYYETEDFFFVHGGLNPGRTIAGCKRGRYMHEGKHLWERSHLECTDTLLPWVKTVVCGHTIHRRPVLTPQIICIDTGAFMPHVDKRGHLTAIELPSRQLFESDSAAVSGEMQMSLQK